MAVMYTPQPILPTLSAHFAVAQPQIALLITLTFLPLALAPVVYGLLLQKVSAKRLLLVSFWVLVLCQLALAFASTFSMLLLLRIVQGVAIPAVLTGLMTYLSSMSAEKDLRWVMAGYVAATVLGGFIGRVWAGWMTTQWGWEWAFVSLGLATAAITLALHRLPQDPGAGFQRMQWSAVRVVLQQRGFLPMYGGVFCIFGVFAAVLTLLPFRLLELEPGLNETAIGWMYSGYLMGVLVALLAPRLAYRIGTPWVMVIAIFLLLGSLLLLTSASRMVWFMAVFVLCGGMFMVHSLVPGELHQRVEVHRGVVNGLYISFYYSGGTAGSFFPGYVYNLLGWNAVLMLLAVVTLLGGWWLWRGTPSH